MFVQAEFGGQMCGLAVATALVIVHSSTSVQ